MKALEKLVFKSRQAATAQMIGPPPSKLHSQLYSQLLGGGFQTFIDFRRLVLGCMDSYDSEKRHALQSF